MGCLPVGTCGKSLIRSAYETDTQVQDGTGADDAVPTSPDPLSPGRTDLNPSDRPGVDELPHNEGQIPLKTDDDAPAQEGMTDVDVDNA